MATIAIILRFNSPQESPEGPFAGLKFVFTSRRVGDEKRSVGFVSPRHPCAACGGSAPCVRAQDPTAARAVRAVTVPGAERLQGQGSDPRRVWKSCEADRDKHYRSLFSVKQLRKEGSRM